MADLSEKLKAKKKLVEAANLKYLNEVNGYANEAYIAGQALGNDPDRIRYAIKVIAEMQDRCDSPEETIERLTESLKTFV